MKLLRLVLACVLLLFIAGCGAGDEAADDDTPPAYLMDNGNADASAACEQAQLPQPDDIYDTDGLADATNPADVPTHEASDQTDSAGVAPLPVLYEEAVQIPYGFKIDKAMEILAAAEEMFAYDDGQLWRHDLRVSVLLWDRATDFAIANAQDPQGRLAPSDGFYIGIMPLTMPGFYQYMTLSGERWIFYDFPAGIYGEGTPIHITMGLIAHGAFHSHQSSILGVNPGTVPMWDNEEALRLRSLETDALVYAMRAEGDERLTHLKNALAIRAFRRTQLPPAEIDGENVWEVQEGSAMYTERFLPRVLTIPEMIDFIEVSQYFSRGGVYEGWAWFYHVGLMYILLLDYKDPELRHGLHFGADLGFRVGAAFGISELPVFEGLGL